MSQQRNTSNRNYNSYNNNNSNNNYQSSSSSSYGRQSDHRPSSNNRDSTHYRQDNRHYDGGDYHRGGDNRSSNYYHNNRRNENNEGNYRNYDNKTVSMKQSHHNNSSSSDSFKYKENYNRRDDRMNNYRTSEQDYKRKTNDSNNSNVDHQVKKVKFDEKPSSVVSSSNNSIIREKEEKDTQERLQQQLSNETLLLENNDEEQVAVKREERRKRFKQMEELILSELNPLDSTTNQSETNAENSVDSDDGDEEEVEALKEYNTNDERALFIHQIEQQREKDVNTDEKSPSETKVTSLYDEKNENSESPIIDMFADSPDTLVKLLNNNSANQDNNTATELYDDVDGYYRYTIGEVINQRYKIEQFLGQGVFSCVVKATDLNSIKISAQTPTLVAIKIIRNIESMKKAGLKELDLLSKINEKETQEYNIIKMIESFTYRNHLCIVFELLEMNLRDVLKNYGKVQGHQHSVGISIQACKIYTKQLVNALKYIQECNIIHADIKPDNILLDHSHQFVKLGDFGSACHISENSITPYLVSRFYRAPEIILGMKYSYPIDMWSIACTVYELYTGKILFTSQNNNDHLRLIMELKGKFPNKVLKKCAFREHHFENDAFLFREFDKLTKKIKVSKMYFQRNTRDLKAMLLNSMLKNHQHIENESEQVLLEEKKQVMQLHDFLEKALALDPSKRLSASEALQHPFITN